MLTQQIKLKSFTNRKSQKNIKKELKSIIDNNNEITKSMSQNYEDGYDFKRIKKVFDKNDVFIIGMGGSILGAQAIYHFLKDKIKKKFLFIDNLISKKKKLSQKRII